MISLKNLTLKEVAKMGRSSGRNLLMFELGKDQAVCTTESISQIPSQLGDAVALVVNILHRSAKRNMPDLTPQEVLEALTQEIFTRAKIIIDLKKRVQKKESA
jgi:hypothetical protein